MKNSEVNSGVNSKQEIVNRSGFSHSLFTIYHSLTKGTPPPEKRLKPAKDECFDISNKKHVIARHDSASVKIIDCSKQSNPPSSTGKIASECSILDCLKGLTPRNDVKSGKFFSHSPRMAFTLAEVLITLGIIGVVAAMTIPTLMNNSNDAEIKTGVKTAYSILSQVMTTVSTDNSGSIKGICNDFDNVCFKNLFKEAFSYTKECDNQVITNGCWATEKYFDNTTWTMSWLNGSDPNCPSAIMLKNGMLVLFRWHSKDCSYPNNDKCGWINVDVNGFKKPNKLGKDTFGFHIQDGLIKPFGSTGDTGNASTCNSTDTGLNSGDGCTYQYLYGN